ncbi:MetQ/NlpA family ABC transporter substrate-binding protein [Marinivivus vitaminiproducens]|uniref:MetQ/NlpA family ABC transporter substrate-binding protein n=1 Tax=Marinivivus vitaminiproducens TaxID=3035935 RepID=UPI00279BAC07|nr:MetQ/NlpA family ABC transporter substrate-binding protein [Geminicoccaceae bacterium SCSIO 64248]
MTSFFSHRLRPSRALGALGVAALLSGTTPAWADAIRVGVSAGPHAEIMEVVGTVAEANGLALEVVEFTDYVIPNEALANGEIEANSFQHQPYLDNQIQDRGYDLTSVGLTVLFPMGFYSQKVDSLDALPDGATIAIQNDPTNGGRSLLLLASEGVIGLAEDVGLAPSILDITDNPKNLNFIELDAAQLPRSLGDVDAAAVNTNYAIESGLDPLKDAIAREGTDSPYTNIVAVRAEDRDQPWVKTLVAAYHSPEVKDFIAERFQGSVVAGW